MCCRPTSLDAFVFGYLAPLHKASLPSAQLQQHLKQLHNLCQFCTNILKNYFSEAASGKTTGSDLVLGFQAFIQTRRHSIINMSAPTQELEIPECICILLHLCFHLCHLSDVFIQNNGHNHLIHGLNLRHFHKCFSVFAMTCNEFIQIGSMNHLSQMC